MCIYNKQTKKDRRISKKTFTLITSITASVLLIFVLITVNFSNNTLAINEVCEEMVVETIDGEVFSLKEDNKNQNQNQGGTSNNGGSSNQGGSSNNGNGSTGKTEVDNDGYIFEDNNEYPSGSINDGTSTPPDTFFQEDDPSGGIDFTGQFDNNCEREDSSGELIGNVEINP